MLSAPGNHPAHQRGHFQAGVRALIGRDAQVRLGQFLESGRPGQREDRDQPGRRHEIRIIEHCRGRPRRVASCIYEMPVVVVEIGP